KTLPGQLNAMKKSLTRDATGTGTMLIAVVALSCSMVAVICTEPRDLATTSPVLETVAKVVSLELHCTGRSNSRLPLASRPVTLRRTLSAMTTIGFVGDISTLATGRGPLASLEQAMIAVMRSWIW